MYAVITTLNIKLFTLGGLGIVPNIAKTIALPPQRARPDGGKYFAPGKCRRSHRGRGRSDRGGHPDRHQGVRGSAHDRSNWGQRRGSLGSLPGRHTSHATGCPHCHRTPWAENCCLERLMDTGTSLEAAEGSSMRCCGRTNTFSIYRKQAQPCFEEGWPGDRLTSNPHGQTHACLSRGAEGPGLPSVQARRMSASNGEQG